MDPQQWIEENRPDGDPDYQRLAAVTESIEAENRKTGPYQALNRRFDYDMALRYGMRRTEDTSQKVKLENPDELTLRPLLIRAWAEGFVFGSLAYREERRGRKAEPFLDRIALANINHKLSSADQDAVDGIFSDAVSVEALGFVSTVRSFLANRVLRDQAVVADHTAIKNILAGHWLDGFFVGLVFEEMGGRRER